MEEGTNESDSLKSHGNRSMSENRNKDSTPILCSTRWRIVAYISLSFAVTYMHRVNLSLAVVCMVNTAQSGITESTIVNSDLDHEHKANNSLKVGIDDIQVVKTNLSLVEDSVYDIHNKNKTSNIQRNTDNPCGGVTSEEEKGIHLEIQWKKSEVSILLSSYFYGSLLTQILAGTLSDIFGGKHIITTAMLVSAICSMLTPIAARTSLVLMFIIRITIGLAGGAMVPAGMSMINSWAIPNERAVMIAVSHSGAFSGSVITYLTSGLLCAYGFDNGWASIFYIHGCITVLLTCLWFFEGYSLPAHHPRISKTELEYIETSRIHKIDTKRPKTPWLRLIFSKPQTGTFIAHFGVGWSFFMVLVTIPLFLKDVFKYEAKSNGFYSSLPFVCIIISSIGCGKLSDVFIERKILGHLATRRMFSTVSLLGMAVCLVSAGYVSCGLRFLAVVLLCLGCTFTGFAYGGVLSNHPEYAGQFAGTAFGITNAGGVMAGIVASMTAGFLTPNGKQEEWQRVFFLAAGVNIIGTVAYLTCSDVYLQPWAMDNKDTLIIEIPEAKELQEIKKNVEKVSSSSEDLHENIPLKDDICDGTEQDENNFEGTHSHN